MRMLQKDLEIRDLRYQAQERQLKDYAEKLRAAEEELQTQKAQLLATGEREANLQRRLDALELRDIEPNNFTSDKMNAPAL